ncbi:MAG: hypothetical protein IPP80_02950 [Ignavibacteria bacterium]|nr:hypothetical protein [Ignavibacteria bacterium]
MKSLLLLLCVVCAVSVASADTLYVAPIAEPGGDGQSWNTAFRSLNFAFADWADGDEIWLANGTYAMPDSGMRIKNGMKIYGGFKGSETRREQRDWYRNLTILRSEGGRTVLRASSCDSTTRIDGLVLEGATVSALIVSGGEPRLFNCHFRNNTSGVMGAAILATGIGRMRVEYCVFEGNVSEGKGGAVYILNSTADTKGFGPFIGQCLFVNNQADEGGGIWFEQCAGMPQIASSVFHGNKTASFGGAIGSISSYVYITNTTFSRNVSLSTTLPGGRTLYTNGGHLQNSIIWNGDDDTTQHIGTYEVEGDTMKFTSLSNVVERDFVNGFWQNDPVFENADNVNGPDGFFGTDDDGLALSSFSAVRNAGVIDKFVNHRQQDVIGNPRLAGRKIDLGAYESQRSGRVGYREVMEEMRTGKLVFMFRHGKTDWDQKDPGPEPSCFPGRNLIAEGREQCTGIGAQQRALGVSVGDAFSSPVCRCWETLDKMVGRHEKKSHWASGGGDAVTAARLLDLETVPTNGNRVISTHDAVANLVFNPAGDGEIMTTAELMEGDALIVRPSGDTMEVIAQWCSDTWERYHVRFPDDATSVDDDRQIRYENIVVSPTPANDIVRISADRACTVRVVDMTGRVVASVALLGNGQPLDLNVASWTSGLYSIIGENVSGRIVITR